ncbi:MAG: PepSY-associated TM helix domain-containing protein, partial [Bacteroidota bacterium]
MEKSRWISRVGHHQKKWYLRWHLYLGLFAGTIIMVVALSGTVLTFRDEIDRWLNPDLLLVKPQGEVLAIHKLLEITQRQESDWEIVGIFVPELDQPERSYQIRVEGDKRQIFINPYDGQIIGSRVRDDAFIGIMLSLHRRLLLPTWGRYIVGISALILVIMTITGLRQWIPKRWKMLQSRLSVRFSGSKKRQNYDWHNALGFYSAPFVLILALTGFGITFTTILVPLSFLLSGEPVQTLETIFDPQSVIQSEKSSSITVEEAITIAEATIEGGVFTSINMPHDSLGAFQVFLNVPQANGTLKREFLAIDQYSGGVIYDTPHDGPYLGMAFLDWLTPLHYGTFGGSFTRWVVFFASLIPVALYFTGLFIWLPRFKKQRKSIPKTSPVKP